MSYQTTKKIILLVLIAALILCFSGNVFAAKPDQATEKENVVPVTEAPEKEAPKHDPKEVIAKVGDNELTREKIEWMQEDASPEIVKKIADWWIETELLYKDALKNEEMFKDNKDRYLFDLQKKKMYVVKLVDHLQVKDFKISDEEAKAYYEKNKDSDVKLQSVGQATFYHIECDSLEKAQEVLKNLEAGQDIKELAKKESIAKDAKDGGYIRKMGFGVIERRFGKEIAKEIEKAAPNKFIGPLKNQNEKYEIFSVESLKETQVLSFEKARDKINSVLLGQKRQQYFEDYRKNLEKNSPEEIYRSPILSKIAEETESAETKETEKK